MRNYAAQPPFRRHESGWIYDANDSRVLACGEDNPCPRLYAEDAIDADAHFICPHCGRLGQRMVEATAKQCGLGEVEG